MVKTFAQFLGRCVEKHLTVPGTQSIPFSPFLAAISEPRNELHFHNGPTWILHFAQLDRVQ